MKVDTYRGPVLVRANYQYVIFLLRENRKIFSFLQENLASPSPIVLDGKFVFSKTESLFGQDGWGQKRRKIGDQL